MRPASHSKVSSPVHYAVVGLGHIVQSAVLPAFAHARDNSQLVALVSDDPEKLRTLGERYGVDQLYDYDGYDECLASGEIDAVYIGLPNHLHKHYALRALEAGVHVLCEKPLALTEADCGVMVATAFQNKVKLMTAYRLHFEEANLTAIEIARSGRIGEVRLFNSVFSMQVQADNIRTRRATGGGTLYDIGIYCINAARYLFRAEPSEVLALSAAGDDPRFAEIDEMTGAVLRFPGERIATFITSFGAASVSSYQIVGTKGDLRVDPAYDTERALRYVLTVDGRSQEKTFARRDHFAPELLVFSRCILEDREPEASGMEGLADIRVIEALLRSAGSGQAVRLGEHQLTKRRPSLEQEIHRPPVEVPDLVNVESPTRD